MGSFEKPGAIVRTKRLWLLAAQLLASSWLVVAFNRLTQGSESGYLLHGAVTMALSIGLGLASVRWFRERHVNLRADASGLIVDGRLEVTRQSIRTAHTHRRGALTFVRLVRQLRPVEVVVVDEREGQALMAALRLDPTSTVLRYGMADGTRRQMLVRTGIIAIASFVLAMAVVPLFFDHFAAGLAAEVLLMALYLTALLRQNLALSVGADGLRIRRWLGGVRFLHYSDILHVTMEAPHVWLHLRDGATLTMWRGGGAWLKRLFGSDQGGEVESFVARVTERLNAHRAQRGSSQAVLARAGRSTEQWLRDLGCAAESGASFRTPAIPQDVLWDVVEDATAPASARVGAAVALNEGLDEDSRKRLRVVAEACAAPRLRVALEAAASAEDDRALSSALDDLPLDADLRRFSA